MSVWTKVVEHQPTEGQLNPQSRTATVGKKAKNLSVLQFSKGSNMSFGRIFIHVWCSSGYLMQHVCGIKSKQKRRNMPLIAAVQLTNAFLIVFQEQWSYYRYFSWDLLTARKYRMLLSLSLNLRVMIDLLRLFSVLLIVLCMFLCVCMCTREIATGHMLQIRLLTWSSLSNRIQQRLCLVPMSGVLTAVFVFDMMGEVEKAKCHN